MILRIYLNLHIIYNPLYYILPKNENLYTEKYKKKIIYYNF